MNARGCYLACYIVVWPLVALAQTKAPPATSGEAPPSEFEQAAGRVSSPQYAHQRYEAERRQNINRQVALQSQVLWRSGFASPQAPVWPLSITASGVSPSPRDWPGSPDLYSPYYFGPFEPTPFWPGYIWGYPYVPMVEQPIGYRHTAKNNDMSQDYVYEPVYADDVARQQQAEALAQREARGEAAAIDPDLQRFAELDDLDAALDAADAAFRAGDYRLAILELTRAGEEIRNSPRAELLRGYALTALGSYRHAARALHRALVQLPPAWWQAEADQAAQRFAQPAEYDRQLARLEEFVRQQPNDADARVVLGLHYGFRGYPRDAVRQLTFATDLGIDFDTPQGEPGDALVRGLASYFQSRIAPAPQPGGPRAF